MISSKTLINMIETGKCLKKYAQRYGYTVKDIQQYLGLSCPQPIYRWYKGAVLPLIDHLLRLSELYRVHMDAGNDAAENLGILIEDGSWFIVKRNLRRGEFKEDWIRKVKECCKDIRNPRDGKTVYACV